MAPFFTIWGGQAFSLFGSNLVQFALVWWLTKSTGSATVLATATLVALLPQIFLGPLAGTLVDRWNRRVVMIVADSCIALVSLGMAYLFFMGSVQIWQFYLVLVIRSAGGAFHWPAMQASTSLMVPGEQLSRVSGLNQTLSGAMGIIAPPTGAFLLGVLPMQSILLVDVGTAAMAVLPLFFINVPQPDRTATAVSGAPARSSVLEDFRIGLKYVWARPGILAVMLMATILNFLINPAFSLTPLLVTKHFGGDAIQLGLLDSTWGIGLLVGGLVLSAWGGFRRRVITSMLGLIGMGVGVIMIGAAPASLFVGAVAGMAVGGFMNPMVNGPLFAVLQATVAPDVQGRVLSLLTSVATAMSPLSLAIAGPVSDALGIQVWYLAAGIGCILVGAAGFFIPAVMHLEDEKPQAALATGEGFSVAAPEVAEVPLKESRL